MNQQLLPNLDQFLKEIDPQETIDREKALKEITLITLLQAVASVTGDLSKKEQEELNRVLKVDKKFDFGKIYSFFTEKGKREKLFKAIDDQVDKIRADYMKTHLKSISPEKRKQCLKKFPSLKALTKV